MGNRLSAPAASFDDDNGKKSTNKTDLSLEKANAYRFDSTADDDDDCVDGEDGSCDEDETNDGKSPLDLVPVGAVPVGAVPVGAVPVGVVPAGAVPVGVASNKSTNITEHASNTGDNTSNVSSAIQAHDVATAIEPATTGSANTQFVPADTAAVQQTKQLPMPMPFPQNVSRLKFDANSPKTTPFPFDVVMTALLMSCKSSKCDGVQA